MSDRWIVRTLHTYPDHEGDRDEWIEWAPYDSPEPAEWRAEQMMVDFPGIVIDYTIERESTVRTPWGRYGDG